MDNLNHILIALVTTLLVLSLFPRTRSALHENIYLIGVGDQTSLVIGKLTALLSDKTFSTKVYEGYEYDQDRLDNHTHPPIHAYLGGNGFAIITEHTAIHLHKTVLGTPRIVIQGKQILFYNQSVSNKLFAKIEIHEPKG